MAATTSRRFGLPKSNAPAPSSSSSPPSSSSPSTQQSHTHPLYSQSRLRPVNQRAASSASPKEEDRASRASVDTTGGASVETVTGTSGADGDHVSGSEQMQTYQSTTGAMQPSPHSDGFHTPLHTNPSGLDRTEDGSEEEDDEVDGGPEEYVVALHDFSSSNATCLSFLCGQVIKVFNRDESGWWDGELDGQRGWFPSNYVDEDGMTTSVEMQSMGDTGSPRQSIEQGDSELDHGRNRTQLDFSTGSSSSSHTATHPNRSIPNPSRSPTPTATTYLNSNRAVTSVLDPIYHAISLLHNAVRANRVAHFQPSTACVISSVRSVLSATDCLTRESSVLKAHPILAKERKQILAELSRLVTQARSASAPMSDESGRGREMEEMLHMADFVLKNVKTFLEVAIECGVAVPDRRSSVYDDLYDDRKSQGGASTLVQTNRNLFSPPLDRSDQDKTPTPESPRSSTYRTAFTSGQTSPRSARSFIDVRSAQPLARPSNSHTVKGLEKLRERQRSDSLRSETQSSSCDHSNEGGSGSGSGSRSGSGSGSGSGPGSHTSHSDSCESLTDDVTDSNMSSSESSVSGPLDCSPVEVLDRLKQANDHLLSIIAAFIGHIHGHTRDSHASSYAFLIDLTRATVDGVRNLLVVVEAVHQNASLQANLPRQMSILWETRESVYEATAALVTAARIITCASSPSHGPPSTPVFASEEEEKSKLLQTATAVLRTGGECVGAVKLCLNRASPDLQITISALTPSQEAQRKRENEDAAAEEQLMEQRLEEEAMEEYPSTTSLRRGKHTLSFLGRKATSLSCLREQYERDDASLATSFGPIEEGGEERGAGSSRRAAAMEGRETVRARKQPAPLKLEPLDSRPSESTEGGGEGSDSSEAMSRDHSRTSGSTLHSARSDSTADTSARPSMDRSDGDHAVADDNVPHSAPVQGSFSRGAPAVEEGTGSMPMLRNRSTSLAASEELHPPPAVNTTLRTVQSDHDQADVCFNSEGQLTGATIQALVERMTPHDTTVDATTSNTFFLCFRLFTTPDDLFDALEARYNIRAPVEVEMDADEFTKWTEMKVTPVRLRVFNFFKAWLETHWNASTDSVILERLIHFTQSSMTHSLHRPGQRLSELAMKRKLAGKGAKTTTQVNVVPTTTITSRGPGSLKRIISTDRVKLAASATDVNTMYSPASFPKSGPTPPTPIVAKSLLTLLRSTSPAKVNVVDFDTLELARQFTIMESKIYCSILPEELLGQEFSKKAGVSNAVHVKTMSSLSTHITGWISECILGEEDARKRTQLIKFFIKLGDRCHSLSNFNTLMAIQCALNSSTIARLKKTWDGLPPKYRHMMDNQRRAIEHTRNFAGYRQTLRQTVAPALPFVGLFLTDLTFCHEGNASTRPSPLDTSKKLLNFDKYVKMSRIIGDLQRFQVPYNLVEVPEIQSHLQVILNEVQHGKGAGSADDLYRRSLLLEPRNNSSHNDSGHHPSPATIAIRGATDSKLGLDLFNWK